MEKNLIRLLKADEIECRVSVINERGLSLLLYKDARVNQRILDETFGPFGWKRSHQCIDGNLYCTVEILDKDTGEWVSIQDKSGKLCCYDRYNSDREISSLVIVNDKGSVVYELKAKADTGNKKEKEPSKQNQKKALQESRLSKEQMDSLKAELGSPERTERTAWGLFTLMSAIAQFERDVIADRTREGLRSARARGRMGGRPKTDPNIIKKAVKLYRTGQYSIKEIEELTGVKKSTLYRNLKMGTNEER